LQVAASLHTAFAKNVEDPRNREKGIGLRHGAQGSPCSV
jgi:hypothetical protein